MYNAVLVSGVQYIYSKYIYIYNIDSFLVSSAL